jgi:CPA2 family monovalent cation:H+ antiporter-2
VAALGAQLSSDPTGGSLTQTMEHVAAALPGLGEPVPVVLPPGSSAIGQSLAELNLRGLTGATVLCITRASDPEARALRPSGKERLRPGDVLALVGSHESVESARAILEATA